MSYSLGLVKALVSSKGTSRSKSKTKPKSKSTAKGKTRKPDVIKHLPSLPKNYKSDDRFQELEQSIKHQDQARAMAREYNIPIRKQTIPQYRKQIFRAMLKDIEIKKSNQIDSVSAMNQPKGSVVVVSDKLLGKQYQVIDNNPTPISKVTVEDLDESGIAISGESPAKKKFQTVVLVSSDIPTGEGKQEGKVKQKVSQTKQEHVSVKFDVIHPNTKVLPPKKYTKKAEQEQRRILAEYEEKQMIPFLFPRTSRDYLPVEHFNSLKEYDVVLEKPPDTKLKTKLKEEEKTWESTQGNKIQTQMFTAKFGDLEGRFAGLYTQLKVKPDPPTRDNPTPTLRRVKKDGEIFVDNDNTGHFVAYYTNMYSGLDPFTENVWFKGVNQASPLAPTPLKVNKFLGISVLNTLASRQNKALVDVFEKLLGGLTYRLEGDIVDLEPSEQIIMISRMVYDDMVKPILEVKTVDSRFTFDGADDKGIPIEKIRELQQKEKPRMYFKEIKTDDIIEPLSSDLLLRGIVKKYGIEPHSSQAILESLYDRGWISYPRVESEEGMELKVPVELVKPIDDDVKFNKKFTKELVSKGRKEEFYKGTIQEQQILQMIKNAEVWHKKGENFIQTGNWVLEADGFKTTTEDIWLAGDKREYLEDDFDILVADRGISPEDLTKKLITKQIGTPATRTSQLSRLKNSGIISLINNRYIIDTRGLYFVSATKILEENDSPMILDQIKKVKASNSVDEIANLINDFIMMDREYFAAEIEKRAEKLVEAESDLSYLESF